MMVCFYTLSTKVMPGFMGVALGFGPLFNK